MSYPHFFYEKNNSTPQNDGHVLSNFKHSLKVDIALFELIETNVSVYIYAIIIYINLHDIVLVLIKFICHKNTCWQHTLQNLQNTPCALRHLNLNRGGCRKMREEGQKR